MSVRAFLKGLALLRFPEVVKDLGERRFHLLKVKSLREKGGQCRVHDDIRLIEFDLERITIGDSVSICAGTLLALGDQRNGFGRIQIGHRTWIGEYNNLRAGGGDIIIGNDCLISQFCTLIASNHETGAEQPIASQGARVDKSGVVLEDDVWLGAGVVVLPGVVIGQGAVIGAGSVVTKKIPRGEIHAGVPARRIGVR